MSFPASPRTAIHAAAAILLLSAGTAAAQSTVYPLTLENCGREITFQKAPERTVSLGQSVTETLYLLDLADRVVGTAVWTSPVLEAFEEVDAGVPRLADNEPSFESVLAQRPDFVATQFEWQVGAQGVVGTPEQFAELGIPVYVSPADCVGKDNSGGGDGVRRTPFTMELIHREVRELAEIFDERAAGEALVAELVAREKSARERLSGLAGEVTAVFWFSSADDASDPYVAGANGAPGTIMDTLGVANIIASDEEWPTVGWETIVRANPTVIVAGDMARRRYPADDIAVKLDFLKSDPVASLMPAVAQDRIIVMDAQAMNPTIRTIDGIETMAEGLERIGLSR